MSVRRGTFCNTDHKLVCTKLLFGKKHYHGVSEKRSQQVKHYDVGKLSCQDSTTIHYLEAVLDQFDKSWVDDEMLDKKWQVLRNALTSAAEDFPHVINQIGSLICLDTNGHCLFFIMKPTLSG